MDTKTLKEQIATLNLQVENLNAQRAKNIGKKETLEAQKAKLIAQYEAAYGVHLTDENIESEFQRVVAEKTKEAKLLAEVLHSIQSGNYAHANALMGVKADEAPVYSSDDMVIRKGELEHKSYEVGTAGVVATQMDRNAEAVAVARETLANANTESEAVTEKTAEVLEVPKPASVKVPVEDEEDDDVIPSIAPKISAKPAIKMPVGFDDDEDDGVVPTIAPKVATKPKVMTSQSAPMDALEGFTAPQQQTAPKAVDAFETAPSATPSAGAAGVSSKAKSFSELFGGNFGV